MLRGIKPQERWAGSTASGCAVLLYGGRDGADVGTDGSMPLPTRRAAVNLFLAAASTARILWARHRCAGGRAGGSASSRTLLRASRHLGAAATSRCSTLSRRFARLALPGLAFTRRAYAVACAAPAATSHRLWQRLPPSHLCWHSPAPVCLPPPPLHRTTSLLFMPAVMRWLFPSLPIGSPHLRNGALAAWLSLSTCARAKSRL